MTWDKGRASIYILRTAFGVDWAERIRIIFAGDDVTDEDAIVALKGMAYTFRIVNNHLTKTSADKRLPSTDSVLTMLKWVERHMSTRYGLSNLLHQAKRSYFNKNTIDLDLLRMKSGARINIALSNRVAQIC